MSAPTIVGAMIVRNEDLWIEQAVRNIVGFCDVLHIGDNGSTDETREILERVTSDHPHVELRGVPDMRQSHAVVEQYAGADVWVFGVDGDELYDPFGLERLRAELLAGVYSDRWRVKSNVLNAVSVDAEAGTATGYLAPPARPVTKLFNFAALERWRGPSEQLLHGGDRRFRPGFDHDLSANLADRHTWDESYFRCLHCCFVARSSHDDPNTTAHSRINPLDVYRQRHAGARAWMRSLRPGARARSDWKNHAYRRGELVTVDVRPILAG